VVQGLGTRDLTKAMSERWARKAEFDRQIDRLRLGEPLTADEVNEEAARAYGAMLAALGYVPPDVMKQHDWEMGDPFRIAGDIAMMGGHGGVESDRASKTFRLLTDALISARTDAVLARLAALRGEATESPPAYALPHAPPAPPAPVRRPAEAGAPISGM